MKGGNLPTGSSQDLDTGLVYKQVLAGASGSILVEPYSTLRVRAAAVCTVTMNVEQHLITFNPTPAPLGNAWQLTFGALGATAGLTDGSTAAQVQAAIRAVNVALNAITVTGSFYAGFTIVYNGYIGYIAAPTVTVNTLTDASLAAVSIGVGETVHSFKAMTLNTGEIEYFNAGGPVKGALGNLVFFNFSANAYVQVGLE